MTLGVAPGASVAGPLPMTDTEPTTLSEFVDDAPAADDAGDAPTPAENAVQIKHLIDCVETLTEQYTRVVDEIEERDTTDRTDAEPPTADRMFQ
jgi:hypothetical protein